jgi:WD40 repeat protein
MEWLDNDTLASGSFDKTIKTWDLRQSNLHNNNNSLYTLTCNHGIVMINFSYHDTFLLASALDNEINQYNGNQVYIRDMTRKYNIPHITVSKNIFLNGSYPGISKTVINSEDIIQPLILPESAELIHYNYLIGNEKEERMKQNNMWYIK